MPKKIINLHLCELFSANHVFKTSGSCNLLKIIRHGQHLGSTVTNWLITILAQVWIGREDDEDGKTSWAPRY